MSVSSTMAPGVRGAWADHLVARAAERRRIRAKLTPKPETEEWRRILAYTPQAGPQVKFHASTSRYRGYGGAAGGGKSYGGLMEAIRFALEHPGVTGVVFRRTYRELQESLILTLLKDVPGHLYTYTDNRHEALFANGSRIWFRHCENERAVYSYQSAQFDFMLIDEATHFTWPMVQYLLTRLRATRDGVASRAWFMTNPGGIGHAWFKAIFVDRDAEWAAQHDIDLDQWEFIPALLKDNPILTTRDPEYEKSLLNLPPDERKALLEGRWDLFAGQFFNLVPTVDGKPWHVHRASDFTIAETWPRLLSMDYGGTAPNVVLDSAYDKAMDRIIFVGEDVRADCTVPVNAARVIARWDVRRYRRVADPEMFARDQVSNGPSRSSIADQWAREGCSWERAFNGRADGWQLFRSYMGRVCNDGLPALIILDTCPTLLRELPQQVYDPHNPEDIKQTQSIPDHACDAARYGITAWAGRTESRGLRKVGVVA